MLKQFESHIVKNKLFGKKEHLLLAISGGLDSVVLAQLLKAGGFTFSLAHCNFKLRAKDSNADETFCRELAEKLGVTLYVKSFDTKAHAKGNGLSTQMAARDLRYAWFNQLLQEQKLDYLLTAHHAGDVVETVLINMLRGTGLKGLKGISQKQGKLVRPLLPFTKEELESYAKQNGIKSRLDKSNLDDKYERNFLRLNVIPKLKKLNPGLENTFTKNSARLSQEWALLRETLEIKKQDMCFIRDKNLVLNCKKLKAESYPETVAHYIFGSYGFNQAQLEDLISSLNSSNGTGRLFYSASHQLTINRNEIVVSELKTEKEKEILINSLKELQACKLFLVSEEKKFSTPKKHELLVKSLQLEFPLKIRTRLTGDKFKPFGMKGFKLLSDFMREEKLNAFEKESCKLLVNGNGDIIWVIGRRSDERYRVINTDKQLLKLSLREQ